MGQVEDSAADEPGVDAARRTEVCCLREAAPLREAVVRESLALREAARLCAVDLVLPCAQSHSSHWCCLQRYILDDDKSKYSRP